MYICYSSNNTEYEFVKCQTLKPDMLIKKPIKHYWDENADINRNPFSRTTRIDCDKKFVTSAVQYNDSLKTTNRPDVCDDTMNHIESEMSYNEYRTIALNEDDLVHLNPLVTKI